MGSLYEWASAGVFINSLACAILTVIWFFSLVFRFELADTFDQAVQIAIIGWFLSWVIQLANKPK